MKRLLEGKVAIVTGAGHGVGRGEALCLAEHGAKVVVNDLGVTVSGEGADRRVADEVCEIIQARGGEAAADYADIANWDQAAALVNGVIDTFGRLDIVVNNAGILRDSFIVSMSESDFDDVVRVHLKGTFAITDRKSTR